MPGLTTPEADHRLDLFLDHVTEPLRNDSQRATFAAYAVGLLIDAECKSMEPLAARSTRSAGRCAQVVLLPDVAGGLG